MEVLFHKTSGRISEVEGMLNAAHDVNADPMNTIIKQRISLISDNCDELELLVDKEPVSIRNNAMLCFLQLKQDFYNLKKMFVSRQKHCRRRMQYEEYLANMNYQNNMHGPLVNDNVGEVPIQFERESQIDEGSLEPRNENVVQYVNENEEKAEIEENKEKEEIEENKEKEEIEENKEKKEIEENEEKEEIEENKEKEEIEENKEKEEIEENKEKEEIEENKEREEIEENEKKEEETQTNSMKIPNINKEHNEYHGLTDVDYRFYGRTFMSLILVFAFAIFFYN